MAVLRRRAPIRLRGYITTRNILRCKVFSGATEQTLPRERKFLRKERLFRLHACNSDADLHSGTEMTLPLLDFRTFKPRFPMILE